MTGPCIRRAADGPGVLRPAFPVAPRPAALQAEPELVDGVMLVKQVVEGVAAGFTVVSLEDPARFAVLGGISDAIQLQTPSAPRLWQAWLHAGEATRAAWSAVPPQPIYLKPPHITAPKRSWLVPS